VEGALAVALGAVLGSLVVFRMPQGGSVSLGCVVPVWIVALRHGPWAGMLAGLGLGALNFLLNPQVFHPLQPFLDYGLGFACLGLAGLFRHRPMLGATMSGWGKIGCHVVSGRLFFASYAAGYGDSPWRYSLGYNLAVGLPDLVVALVLIATLLLRAPHLFVTKEKPVAPRMDTTGIIVATGLMLTAVWLVYLG